MTKISNFALKIKGGGREGGNAKSSDPDTPSKFEMCRSIPSCLKIGLPMTLN